MSRVLVLDTGPAGEVAHPRPNRAFAEWLQLALEAGDVVCLPEIVDYELRRNFLLEIAQGRTQMQRSLQRLDQLRNTLQFLPINSVAMLHAAQLWAEARRRGRSTADPKELDSDVILAAQALQVQGIVVTYNIGHLDKFVEARPWQAL
jgi:predicted nucleic acid-binding protein